MYKSSGQAWGRSLVGAIAAAGLFLSFGGMALQAAYACDKAPAGPTAALGHTGPINAAPASPVQAAGTTRAGQNGQLYEVSYGSLFPRARMLKPLPGTNRVLPFTKDEDIKPPKPVVAALDKVQPRILIRVTRVVALESDRPAIESIYCTLLFSVSTAAEVGSASGLGTADIYWVGDLPGMGDALWSRGNARVKWQARIMLRSGAPGTVEAMVPLYEMASLWSQPTVSTDPESGLGFEMSLLARLNLDGSITVHAFGGERATAGSGPASLLNRLALLPDWRPGTSAAPPLALPGIRMQDGDTVMMRRIAPVGAGSSIGDRWAVRPLGPTITNPDTPWQSLYFITCNVVDEHGQRIPGGPDAIRRVVAQMLSGEPGEAGRLSNPFGVR